MSLNYKVAPGERIDFGDAVFIDPKDGLLCKAEPQSPQAFRVPPHATMTTDGFLVMPETV